MPRNARVEASTQIYHIVFRGVNHEKVFETEKEKRKIIWVLCEKMNDYKVEIYAYCVMTTHVHILLRGDLKEISKFLGRVEITYAMFYNKSHDRNGHLFQNRFYTENIESENHFWNCIYYIHNNPVKAGVAKKPADYLYSSFHEYMNEQGEVISKKGLCMLRKKYDSKEQFEKETIENKQSQWFLGTEEEMKTQKHDLIVNELKNIDIQGYYEKNNKTAVRKELCNILSKKLGVSKQMVLDILKDIEKN